MSETSSSIDAALDLAGDEVWIWTVPNPEDPVAATRKRVQTRIGVRDGHQLAARLEICGRRPAITGGWTHELLAVGGRKPREVGTIRFEFNHDRELRGGRVAESRAVAARWSTGGLLALPDAADVNALMTRGGPIHDREPLSLGEALQGVKDVAGRLAGKLRNRGGEAAAPEPADDVPAAESAAPTAGLPSRFRPDPVVVDAELTAFDGWLRARQHQATDGPPISETWRLSIDRERTPPGPLGLSVVAAAAAVCHRRLLSEPTEGVIDFLP